MSANYYPVSRGFAYIVSTRSPYLDIDLYSSILAVAEGLQKKGHQSRAYSTRSLGPSVVQEVISARFARQYRSISNLQGTKKVILIGDYTIESNEPSLDELRAHYLFRKNDLTKMNCGKSHLEPKLTWSTLVWEWLCSQNVQNGLSQSTARGLVYGILHAHLGTIDETVHRREAEAFRSICHLYNFSETHNIAPELFTEIKDNFFKDVRYLWESAYTLPLSFLDTPITVYPFECWDISENEVARMEEYLRIKRSDPWIISCVSVKHQINLLIFNSQELASMWSRHPSLKFAGNNRAYTFRIKTQAQMKKMLSEKFSFRNDSSIYADILPVIAPGDSLAL